VFPNLASENNQGSPVDGGFPTWAVKNSRRHRGTEMDSRNQEGRLSVGGLEGMDREAPLGIPRQSCNKVLRFNYPLEWRHRHYSTKKKEPAQKQNKNNNKTHTNTIDS
jgi:hypothetical protein